MRLVFLNQYYPPDAAPTGVMLQGLAEQLVRDGHEVSVLCAAGGYAGEKGRVVGAPLSVVRDCDGRAQRPRSADLFPTGRDANDPAISSRPQGESGPSEAAWPYQHSVQAPQTTDNGQQTALPPRPRIIRIKATKFGRGTFFGKLLDYASFDLGVAWKLLTLRPAPQRIVALTTPPYLSVLARLISKLRGADHAHWVMDVYPDVLAAHGMLDERSLAYRLLAGLARWGFGGKRCAALLTLGPDMAERMGTRVPWVPLWGDGESVVGGPSSVVRDCDGRADRPRSADLFPTGRDADNPALSSRPQGESGPSEAAWPHQRSTQAPLTTDNRQRTTPSPAPALRQARGWGDDELVVMYSGNMGLGHRFEEILAAAKELGRGKVVGGALSGKTQDNKTQDARQEAEKNSSIKRRTEENCGEAPKHSVQAPQTTDNGQRTTLPLSLRIVFFGGGKRRDEVATFASVNPDAGVEIYDYAPAEHLMAHLQSADVHLASLDPAWTGTMVPSKVQGIFGAARPVIFIGSADSSIGRWVLQSGGGWVVAAGDVAGLLAALEAARDPTVRATRGRAAKAFAAEHFDPRRNVARVAQILTRSR